MMNEEHRVKGRQHMITYRIIMRIYFACIRLKQISLGKDFTVSGTENIPEVAPYIIVANHASNMDAFLIAAPFLDKNIQIHWVAIKEILNFRQLYKLYRSTKPEEGKVRPFFLAIAMAIAGKGCEVIPVDSYTENPTKNMRSLRIMLKMIEEGRVIGIYPAGPFTSVQVETKPIFAWIAKRTNVPVVPCYVSCNKVCIGTPFLPENFRHEEPCELANRVMNAINELGKSETQEGESMQYI